MININWQLFLVAALLAVALYLIIIYKDDPKLSTPVRNDYNTKRRIGWGLLIATIALGIYFYRIGVITFKAQMPSECISCNNYIVRHKNLRPYSTSEYGALKQTADACKTCSNMCFDEINLLSKHQPVDTNLINKKKQSCANVTKHAILSRKELDRLTTSMRAKQTGVWQSAHKVGANPSWDPFPKAPTHQPK